MSKPKTRPVALTVAGSDSGGGAGVQADLKTFAALGVHGTCAVTCLTAQNPRRITAICATPHQMVSAQIAAVLEFMPPAAIKTGMLYNVGIIRAVAAALSKHRAPLVVDPVTISTSGTRLLKLDAISALETDLISRAALVTPNLAEAQVFLERRLVSPEDLRRAARDLHARWGCAVLVKGGHLPRARDAVDFFYDGREELLFSAPFVRGVRTHGTGCVYSAAITAWLARGRKLPEAIRRAKDFLTRAIAGSRQIGRGHILALDFSRPE